MRLDRYLAEHEFSSRTKAARALERGLITVNGKPGKASDDVSEQDVIEVCREEIEFVSEGGYKLNKALKDFKADVSGKVFIDLGASTGGFTDCLLQSGAAYVYAVDVGTNQLDVSIASDSRVVVMDGINARYLKKETIPRQADGVVTDVSFISLTYILPVIAALLEDGGVAFTLIKPQFECGGKGLDKHGIVKDRSMRHSIINDIIGFAERVGLSAVNVTTAPIKQRKNIEYIVLFQKSKEPAKLPGALKKQIEELD